jgi:hypothetical protein
MSHLHVIGSPHFMKSCKAFLSHKATGSLKVKMGAYIGLSKTLLKQLPPLKASTFKREEESGVPSRGAREVGELPLFPARKEYIYV